MIPLKFHFIWIGKRFPFVNRLAVESVLQTHPGARVILHFEDPPVDNADWGALKAKVDFRLIDLESLMRDLPESLQPIRTSLAGISSGYPAGRSNVLRYLILHREGGIYLDFDTITLKSFEPLLYSRAFLGEEEVFRCDDDRVAGKFTWDFPFAAALFGISYALSYANCRWLGNNGVLNLLNRGLMKLWSARKLNNAVIGSEPGGGFLAETLRLIPDTNAGMRFALGPMLMNRVYATPAQIQLRRMDKDVFYTIPPSQTFRFFYGPGQRLSEDAIAIHWCSSNHKKLAAGLTREYFETTRDKTLYVRLAKEVLARGV